MSWKPPAELSRAVPREVEITAHGIVLTVLVFVFMVAGAAGGVYVWRQASARGAFLQRLDAEGAIADGVVVRRYTGPGHSSDRYVAYQFQHDGSIYRSTSRVPYGIWNGLKDGQHINIRFVPADPARNRPADWDADRLPQWVAFVVSAGMLIPAALLFAALRKSRGLLTDGRPVAAVVKAHSNAKGGKRARYEFRPPDGATVTGQSDPDRHPTPIGDVICVLYDEENPKRNASYPLQLHRIKGV